MQRVDNKNLYMIYKDNKIFYQSYNTIIAIEEEDKIIINDKRYSTTTSKHKNMIVRQASYKQPILIHLKAFKQIVEDNGLTFNDY